MDDAIPKPGDAPPSVYPEQNRTDFYEVSPSSPRKFKHPHRFDPGEDGPTEPNLGSLSLCVQEWL